MRWISRSVARSINGTHKNSESDRLFSSPSSQMFRSKRLRCLPMIRTIAIAEPERRRRQTTTAVNLSALLAAQGRRYC